jgi:hypothetical protein
VFVKRTGRFEYYSSVRNSFEGKDLSVTVLVLWQVLSFSLHDIMAC